MVEAVVVGGIIITRKTKVKLSIMHVVSMGINLENVKIKMLMRRQALPNIRR